MKKSETVLGWREWLALPDLGIERIKAKIDTGARTSALHAYDIEIGIDGDDGWVSFMTQPEQKIGGQAIRCRAPLVDSRVVRNSGGQEEERPVIVTPMQLGSRTYHIELTLTPRRDMRFRMLLGRHAVRRRFLIDPGRSYLLGRRERTSS